LQIWTDEVRHARIIAYALDRPVLRIGVNQVRSLAACRDNIFSVSAGYRVPLKTADAAAAQAVRWATPPVVVLQAAAEVVRRLIVISHGIKLLDRQVVQIAPC